MIMKNKLQTLTFSILLMLFGSKAFSQPVEEAWVQKILSPQYFAVDVQNMEASVKWYKEALGLEILEGASSKADDGRWEIVNLVNTQLFVELIRDNRSQVVERATGFAKVGFQVKDVKDVANRIFEISGNRPKIINWKKFNMSILQLNDPDGNIIQLTSKILP